MRDPKSYILNAQAHVEFAPPAGGGVACARRGALAEPRLGLGGRDDETRVCRACFSFLMFHEYFHLAREQAHSPIY
eukprot:scaffold10425_cov114-Isochrysis_galbana.AAC.5